MTNHPIHAWVRRIARDGHGPVADVVRRLAADIEVGGITINGRLDLAGWAVSARVPVSVAREIWDAYCQSPEHDAANGTGRAA